jgi:hypothetical protein
MSFSKVAQIGNLLFRRLAVGSSSFVGCQPAIQKTTSLRYGDGLGSGPGSISGESSPAGVL